MRQHQAAHVAMPRVPGLARWQAQGQAQWQGQAQGRVFPHCVAGWQCLVCDEVLHLGGEDEQAIRNESRLRSATACHTQARTTQARARMPGHGRCAVERCERGAALLLLPLRMLCSGCSTASSSWPGSHEGVEWRRLDARLALGRLFDLHTSQPAAAAAAQHIVTAAVPSKGLHDSVLCMPAGCCWLAVAMPAPAWQLSSRCW